MPPSIELAISIFGISEAGGVFVPMHHSVFLRQVAHIANDCEMSALVTSARKFDDLRTESTASIRCAVLTGTHAPERSDVAVLRFDELMERSLGALADVAISKDLAAILYTSGSTGKPKGVMLSHANVLAGASIVSTYLDITEADRTLAALPFSFDAGLNQLMTACQHGVTTVLIGLATAAEIIKALVDEHITGLAGVPTLWSALAASPALGNTPLPHLRYTTNTGGALPVPVLERLRAALPDMQVVLMYGLTEAFRSTYLPSAQIASRPTSMGKAIPDTEILVIDEDGQPCGPGQVGELVHRGPTVSLGYWGQPELTSLCCVRIRSMRWPAPRASSSATPAISFERTRKATSTSSDDATISSSRRVSASVRRKSRRYSIAAVTSRLRPSSGFLTNDSGSRSWHTWYQPKAVRSTPTHFGHSVRRNCHPTWSRRTSRSSNVCRRLRTTRSITRRYGVDPRRPARPHPPGDPMPRSHCDECPGHISPA